MKKKDKTRRKLFGKKSKKPRGKRKTNSVRIPRKLLVPVASFLHFKLKKLEKTKKNISKEDPFTDKSRLNDNASPDTDAAEQFGHARTTAIKEQVERKIIQTKKALTRIKLGKYGVCEVCGEMIDTDRLMIYPETTVCKKDASKNSK